MNKIDYRFFIWKNIDLDKKAITIAYKQFFIYICSKQVFLLYTGPKFKLASKKGQILHNLHTCINILGNAFYS